jgi:L-asparaginase
MRHVTLITTGGTIEKTYDEMTGTLENRVSIVGRMLEGLRLEETTVSIVELLKKDSLYMTDGDRDQIVAAVARAFDDGKTSAVVILHGTDTLAVTGELLHTQLGAGLRGPVVLAGAMRPFEMVRSDALQNLTEAVFATGLVGPGVYCVAHGRVLRFPGVVKDRARGTFVAAS